MEKIRRIVAMISVAMIILLIIAAFICGITGSKYFWGMFFLAIIIPFLLWVFMWFCNLADKSDGKESCQEEEDN